MLHIQRVVSRFVHVATESINKSEKISKREIKNLKLEDLGQDLDLTPEPQTEAKEEPNAITLASELSSTSIEFIKDMGFVRLAEKLTERFGEVKDSWEQREHDINTNISRETNALKAEVEKLRSANAIYEEKLKTQQEKIKDLSESLKSLSIEFENENNQLSFQVNDLYHQKLDQEKKLKDSIEECESKNAKLEKENTALHSLLKAANVSGKEVLEGKNNNFLEITQKSSIEEGKMQKLEIENDFYFISVVPKIQEARAEARGEFAQQTLNTYNAIFSERHVQKAMAEHPDVQFSQELIDIFNASETISA
jgi:chromosome segregation ATPase